MPEDALLSARSRAKRQQIRDGALAAFLELGFTAASTDTIAARAGVSKQTLYAHFRSKDDLLVDVFSAFLERVEPVDEPRPVTTPAELRAALRRLAEAAVHTLTRADYLALVRVVLAEGQRARPVAELWARTVPGRIRQAVAETLTAAAAGGVVRTVPVDAATRMFVGALLTYVLPDGLLADRPESVAPGAAELDQLIDLYLAAIT